MNLPAGWWAHAGTFVTDAFQVLGWFNQMIGSVRWSIRETWWHKRQHQLLIDKIWAVRTRIWTLERCIRLSVVESSVRGRHGRRWRWWWRCGGHGWRRYAVARLVLARQCSIDEFGFLVGWNESKPQCYVVVILKANRERERLFSLLYAVVEGEPEIQWRRSEQLHF